MEKQKGAATFAALTGRPALLVRCCKAYGAGAKRALLLYPTGLEFIAAFFGCLYAGVIAVPVPPPNSAQPQQLFPGSRLSQTTRNRRWR